jgi:predicted RecA/RadA family phage recombinase
MANLTLAQILALFPDNSTGAIDASDVRDALTAIFERTDGTNPIPALRFDTAGSGGTADGTLNWNTTVGTLNLHTGTDATLQVGHEQYILARNTTGATILNGRPVRITGGQGTNALISLGNGQGDIVGVATEDIPNNTTGRVTTFGVVNDINTQAFNDGNILYSSATGTLTTTLTGSFVGVVLNANASDGRILVAPRTVTHSSGTTAQRPTTVFVGFQHFDTTLGLPVFWNGSVWKTAAGATV